MTGDLLRGFTCLVGIAECTGWMSMIPARYDSMLRKRVSRAADHIQTCYSLGAR